MRQTKKSPPKNTCYEPKQFVPECSVPEPSCIPAHLFDHLRGLEKRMGEVRGILHGVIRALSGPAPVLECGGENMPVADCFAATLHGCEELCGDLEDQAMRIAELLGE